jgi:hypothetical protein
MPISELLWMCPECGEDRGLGPDGRCRGCNTVFSRGKGAAIVATRPDGTATARRPAEWLDRMKSPESLVPQQFTAETVIRRAAVEMSRVVDAETVHDESGYLNRIEIWGEASRGTLEIRPDALVLTPDNVQPERWPLETLTAVQASSHSLQLNRREAPLVSFRFLDDAIYLWEELLHAVLRAFYRRTGRGRIVEFQPRIATE